MSASPAKRAAANSPQEYHQDSSTPTSTTTTTTITSPGAAIATPTLRPRGKRPESRADSLGSLVIGDNASDKGRSIDLNNINFHHETPEQIRDREIRTKTLGYFLAKLALTLDDGIKIFHFADKRNWTPDEFEQLRALEKCLDEARADFQELPTLLDGAHYYTNDRTRASLVELAKLHDRLEDHIEIFRMWTRTGGPINPMWVNDTRNIQQDLHNAQCRAARRIFETKQEAASHCLGAFLVYRKQRSWVGLQDPRNPAYRRHCLDVIAACNTVGRFERFGDCDIAFVCNFCDGYIIWDDLESMPSTLTANDLATASAAENSGTDSDSEFPQRTRDESNSSRASNTSPPPPCSHTSSHGSQTQNDTNTGYTYTTHGYSYNPQTNNSPKPDNTQSPDLSNSELPYPDWKATGFSAIGHLEKDVIFAPVAIASHLAPVGMEWRASHICRFCDETFDSEKKISEGNDDLEPLATDEGPGFADLADFHQHLLWQHTPYAVEVPSVGLPSVPESCAVM